MIKLWVLSFRTQRALAKIITTYNVCEELNILPEINKNSGNVGYFIITAIIISITATIITATRFPHQTWGSWMKTGARRKKKLL